MYFKRPSVHKSSWSGVHKADGCGIFFKESDWEAIAVDAVNYADVHDRVGLLVLLRSRHDPAACLLVVTTHVYWNKEKVGACAAEFGSSYSSLLPTRQLATQLKQLQQLDTAARVMLRRCLRPELLGPEFDPHTLPVIVCGDFNNTPDSAVYRYMTQTFMQRQPDSASGGKTAVGPFESAYNQYQGAVRGELLPEAEVKCGKGEPGFSTITHRRRNNIDYIFHNQQLAPLSVLSEPPLDRVVCDKPMEATGDHIPDGIVRHAIPNSLFGSDHMPIMAVFAVKFSL